MADDEQTSYRPVLLKGSDNFPEWELGVYTTLLAKDLSGAVEADLTASKDAKELRKNDKAFALIIQSLAPVIHSVFPVD